MSKNPTNKEEPTILKQVKAKDITRSVDSMCDLEQHVILHEGPIKERDMFYEPNYGKWYRVESVTGKNPCLIEDTDVLVVLRHVLEQ